MQDSLHLLWFPLVALFLALFSPFSGCINSIAIFLATIEMAIKLSAICSFFTKSTLFLLSYSLGHSLNFWVRFLLSYSLGHLPSFWVSCISSYFLGHPVCIWVRLLPSYSLGHLVSFWVIIFSRVLIFLESLVNAYFWCY